METLGAQLRAAGLDEPVLAELFGAAWTSEDVPLVLDRYRADDPRAALVRLFVLGERVPRPRFRCRSSARDSRPRRDRRD